MAINSKVELCNMSINLLGNYDDIENIDTPTSDAEGTYALWYDICRQTFLKTTMPNFALARRNVAQLVLDAVPEPFGYAYEYPADCLKLLGIGSVEDKENNYTVENGKILTDVLYEDGAPLRFIIDYTDVATMSAEWKVGFATYLSSKVAYPITQDGAKVKAMQALLPIEMSALAALNAQENLPVRISNSGFKNARFNGVGIKHRKR